MWLRKRFLVCRNLTIFSPVAMLAPGREWGCITACWWLMDFNRRQWRTLDTSSVMNHQVSSISIIYWWQPITNKNRRRPLINIHQWPDIRCCTLYPSIYFPGSWGGYITWYLHFFYPLVLKYPVLDLAPDNAPVPPWSWWKRRKGRQCSTLGQWV